METSALILWIVLAWITLGAAAYGTFVLIASAAGKEMKPAEKGLLAILTIATGPVAFVVAMFATVSYFFD